MRRVLLVLWLCGVGKGENAPEMLNARLIIHIVDRAGAPALGRAMMGTSKIFEAAGVQVEWTRQKSHTANWTGCPHPGEVRVSIAIVPFATADVSARAVAAANNREGMIVIFYDRVRESTAGSPSLLPIFLAYVLAHEIAHVSQVVAAHSHAGI